MKETVQSFESRKNDQRIPTPASQTQNKKKQRPIVPPRLNSNDEDEVSDDEPPNYLSVLEEHHSMQRNDLYARN